MRPKTVGEENPSNLPAGYTRPGRRPVRDRTPPGRWVGCGALLLGTSTPRR